MGYSTPKMVRQALVPSSDGTQTTGSNTAADLSDDQLNDAIAEADSTINAYIGARYHVPVAALEDGTTPHPLDFWSRNLAAYLATLSYRKGKDLTSEDPVVLRYQATMTALNAVKGGSATLPFTEATGEGSFSAGPAVNPYDGTLWGAEDFVTGGSDYLFPGTINGPSPFWRGWY